MKELLIQYGWEHYYTCGSWCGKKEYYNHPGKKGYRIITEPKRNLFAAKFNNTSVKNGHNYQLEEYLKTL